MFLGAADGERALAVITKAGSQSMIAASHTFAARIITVEEALTYKYRIAYLRHAIAKIDSLFNNLWGVAQYGGPVSMLPPGTILGYGGRLKGETWPNPHHWNAAKQVALEIELDKLPIGLTISQQVRELNNADYRRYIDHVIKTFGKNEGERSGVDQHWQPQIEQLTHEGILVPNVFHRFERDIETTWHGYFGGMLPHEGAWAPVDVDPYQLTVLETIYADDLEKWESL